METLLSILFVAYILSWIIGFCLQISIVRTLQERLPEAGFSNNPFKSSMETTWKFQKFLFRREYRNHLLKLRHSGFAGENQTRANISSGWPFTLERLKATLEGPE